MTLCFSACQDQTPRERLPWGIWGISLAGFFLNVSSVIAFVCSPILLTETLGYSDKDAGVLEGTVEGFALVVRSFAGMFSDALCRRRIFLTWGYGICVLARFLFAPSTITHQAVAARWLEKLGNGLQGSPREAFISDCAPSSMLGRAYGLNRTFSMGGSLAGSVLMFATFFVNKNSSYYVRELLYFSAGCAAVSFGILTVGVKERPQIMPEQPHFSWLGVWNKFLHDFRQFSWSFWKTLGVICIFKLGYFSSNFMMMMLSNNHEAFVFGQGLYQNRGLAFSTFSVLQCVTCALLAYPLGRLSDMVDRLWVVALGFVLMLCSLACFGWGISPNSTYMGILLYGMQLSMQGALMALLSTTMPDRLKGTGFSLFFFMTGWSVVFSNRIILGGMENRQDAFRLIAVCILVALALLPLLRKRAPETGSAA